jgi:hypothetical protein
MRTIAINPVKRGKKVAARKKAKRKGAVAKRKNPTRKAVTRRAKRRNPKAGLSANDMKDLGTAAIGGAAAGALTSYLEDNKPEFLAQVPLEIVSIGAGVALAMFGKTPAMKNVSRGIVSYGAGRLTERMMSEAKNGNGNGNGTGTGTGGSQTEGLIFANPAHYGGIGYSRPNFNDELHVGGLVFSMED